MILIEDVDVFGVEVFVVFEYVVVCCEGVFDFEFVVVDCFVGVVFVVCVVVVFGGDDGVVLF